MLEEADRHHQRMAELLPKQVCIHTPWMMLFCCVIMFKQRSRLEAAAGRSKEYPVFQREQFSPGLALALAGDMVRREWISKRLLNWMLPAKTTHRSARSYLDRKRTGSAIDNVGLYGRLDWDSRRCYRLSKFPCRKYPKLNTCNSINVRFQECIPFPMVYAQCDWWEWWWMPVTLCGWYIYRSD